MEQDAVARAFSAARKSIALTRQEAELIADSFKVSQEATRPLMMSIMGMLLEWEHEDAVRRARAVLTPVETEADMARRVLAKVPLSPRTLIPASDPPAAPLAPEGASPDPK